MGKKRKKHYQAEPIENVEFVLKDSGIKIDERLAWLYEEIHQLDEIDRSLILLLLDGFSYKEMAAILGISESNVGVKINRIKNISSQNQKNILTMEFDEMKKIWDSQNNGPLYAIDENALHNRILSKKEMGYHITNTSELLLIIVNAGTGLFVLATNLSKSDRNLYMYLLAGWMFLSALYILVRRIRRIKGSHQFDRVYAWRSLLRYIPV